MEFLFHDESYDTNCLMELGEGNEGIVYKKGRYAIKVLKPFSCKLTLKEEDIKRIKDLNTKVLEHPIDAIYSVSSKTYLGPVSLYVDSDGYRNFLSLTTDEFLTLIEQMKKDARVYAKSHRLIADLQLKDSLFDKKGQLHLVDSGSYQYRPYDSVSFLTRENESEIDNYLLDEVLDPLLQTKKVSKKNRMHIKTEIKEKYDLNVQKYLEERMKSSKNVEDYLKDIKKQSRNRTL